MVWQDIYFNRIVSKKELENAVAQVFKVEKDDIMIVGDITCLLGKPMNWKILCQSSKVTTNFEFKLKIEFSMNDELEPKNDMKIFSLMSKLLNCKILVDNYLPDPDTMLIVEHSLIDYEDLESFEEFELEL